VVNTGPGSATSGLDYSAFGTQAVTFGPGSGDGATRNVTVGVLNDTLVEGPETLALTLQNLNTTLSGQASLGNTASTATIVDNDSATIAFEFASSTVSEATTPHLVGVKLTTFGDGVQGAGSLSKDVAIFVSDAGGGSATSGGVDYNYSFQTVTFNAGDSGSTQNVSATIVNDTVSEGDETFRLALSTEGSIAAITVDSTPHVVTIADNDIDLTVGAAGAGGDRIAGSGAENLTYTFTVTNNGLTDATHVVLNDLFTLPSGVMFSSSSADLGSFDGTQWTIPSLTDGTTGTITLKFTADHTTAAGAGATAQTTVASADQTLINPVDDSSTVATSISRQSDLVIAKSDSPDPVGPGTQLTYTITVANNGPSDNTSAHISDFLPAGLSNVTWTAAFSGGGNGSLSGPGDIDQTVTELAAGQTVTYTVHGTVTAPANSNLSNTATVASSEDTNSANNSATEATYVGGVDLYLSKTDGTVDAHLGASQIYTLTYGNKGFLTANTVKLTETVPAGATFDAAHSSAGWVETSTGSHV
jgi:uncharacterized repeat protein (TIGR01451 family)